MPPFSYAALLGRDPIAKVAPDVRTSRYARETLAEIRESRCLRLRELFYVDSMTVSLLTG